MKTLWQTLGILVTVCAVTTLAYADQPGLARGFFSGAQEVTTPPGGVTTSTGGRIRLKFARDLAEASFQLDVTNGTDVTAAHLHCGRAGENGPIVVTLFNNSAGVDINGTLAEGTVANTDIDTNAGCDSRTDGINRPVNNIASLFAAIRGGFIYANVHTKDNPSGETRAQLFVEDNAMGGTTLHP